MRQMVSEIGCTFMLRFFFSLLVILPQKGNKKRKFYATVLHDRTEKLWTESEEIK